MSPQYLCKSGIASAFLCCAIFACGCASWQGPRIDPTGESLLVWPNQAPPVVAAPIAPPIVGPPPAFVAPPVAAPPIVALPFGNVLAPPVYPDVPAAPLAPPVITVPRPSLPPGPTTTTVPYGAAPIVPAAPVIPATPIPALPGVSPGVATPLGAAVPVGQDYVRITPDRVLAPVGSEVVLKAGICDADGYLIANQRIEWLLSSGCVGQFVDLGEREQYHVLRAIWDTPRKVDSTYAIGSTANAPICLYRGTPDPTDDVQILRGDAWITVTSAAEGVSHVTAYTPTIADWNLRRAIATIYWVDAQWVLPPSTVVPAGRPHVLTTTVMRRTDGAPLAGWLVRYESASGASFGYEGGSLVEVPTDASGRASVEVSPADMTGGSTTVNITIVRPPQATTDASPRLEIGRGAATISWAAGEIGESASPPEFRPAPIERAPPSSASVTPYEVTPRPTLPTIASPPAEGYTPPMDEPTPGRPQLDLTLRRTTAENLAVGDFASFDIVVTNRGDGTARGIKIRSQFDRGLSHPNAKPNEFAVDYPGMRDLPPGESATIPLTFQVVAGGTQCHEVTVSADGAEAVSARGCVTARQSTLELNVRGHERRNVGEIAEFVAVLRNVGDVAATNIELVARFDEPLEPRRAERGHERLSDGALVMRVAKMEANERREFRMEALCRSAANSACNRVTVTADGGVTLADDACVEILPPAASGGPGAISPPSASNLRLTVTESTNPARVGERQIAYVTVQNVGQDVERQVSVRVLLPPEFAADATQIQPQGEATILGQELRFSAISELQPQAERQYIIPMNVNREGRAEIRAELAAPSLSAPLVAESSPIEILPR
jgi:hypothetical protein